MHQLTDLLAPFARRRLQRLQADLDVVPVPDDAPRCGVPGTRTDRVLLVGNGVAVGFGVRTQELALPGQLSRRLAAATGRGAVVDVLARRGTRVEQALGLLRSRRVAAADGVVLSIGATDAAAFTPLSRWAEAFSSALDQLLAAVSAGTPVVVLPIAPLQRTHRDDEHRRHLSDRHAERLDRITEGICAARGVAFLRPTGSARPPRTAEDYAALAERLVPLLAPRLDDLADDPSPATARAQRRTPDPELLRQAAVDGSGLLGTGSNTVLDRVLQHARERFGTAVAAVTLVDGDEVVYKAASGIDARATPRGAAPCNRAIRQDGPYVVPDLAGEPAAELGWRFYAGHPLESPEGFRIGTFCVLDHRPRTGIDDAALVELAMRVQAELWREIERGPRDAGEAPADTDSLLRPVLIGR